MPENSKKLSLFFPLISTPYRRQPILPFLFITFRVITPVQWRFFPHFIMINFIEHVFYTLL